MRWDFRLCLPGRGYRMYSVGATACTAGLSLESVCFVCVLCACCVWICANPCSPFVSCLRMHILRKLHDVTSCVFAESL